MSLAKWILLALLPSLSGCSTLFTSVNSKTVPERLAAFPAQADWPIQAPLTIHWNDQMIPFVEAENDLDCAFAIGVVHAHLRLGQMEIFRRISAGRISELGGPFQLPKIDRALRTINLQRSARKSLALMQGHEREWLSRYVEGLNFFIANMQEKPPEFGFLDLDVEEWTLLDAVRVGRLASADINWGRMLTFLPLRKQQGWQQVWTDLVEKGKKSVTSWHDSEAVSLQEIFTQFSRSGSNSVVVAGSKTSHGSALIANDPHLGIFAPNLWLLMGYRSPSYHVLGYMLPGLPAVTVGRNQQIAWGGTYMRGISSHLIEVDPQEELWSRQEKIGVRWWLDQSVTIRESSKGPIISDLIDQEESDDGKKSPPIALSWVGHQGSNEFGAFLTANRSQNWPEFRQAFKDYAVAGLNMTYADKEGNAAMMLAIRQPLLKNPEEQFRLVKSADNRVTSYRFPLEHPQLLNPKEGFIASANNMPLNTDPPIASPSGQSDRILRLQELMRQKNKISTADLQQSQLDVFSIGNLAFKDWLTGQLKMSSPEWQISLKQELLTYWKRFAAWDGYYHVESSGAVAFEVLSWQLALMVFEKKYPIEALRQRIVASEDWRTFLREELAALSANDLQKQVQEALAASQKAQAKFKTWGEMHVQIIQSPLGNIPVLGQRFRFQEYPTAGGTSTLNKASFQSGFGQRRVTFGAQSRHVSDMSDLNENYFVMLGGNDGWLDNPNLTNQVEMWRQGQYMKIPMELSEVAKQFSLHQHHLRPKSP